MPKDDVRTIAIYSRKSKFTGKGESIENQIELCRQYISSHYSQEEATAAIVCEDEWIVAVGKHQSEADWRKL